MTRKVPGSLVLAILDGWGVAPPWGGNAISIARPHNMDRFWRTYPHTTLQTSGQAVGLPSAERGNSEVGHLTIGAGRVVFQDYPRISGMIADRSFFKNEVLKTGFARAKKQERNVHLLGLVSNGGVHSHIDHLLALMEFAKQEAVERLYIHMITDGRDTEPSLALHFAEQINRKITALGLGKIMSVIGRYYAMDRDHRWDRVEKAYNCLVGVESISIKTVNQAISQAYRQGLQDEFIPPTAIENDEQPFVPIDSGDTVVFYNFRSDRARELTRAFIQSSFDRFRRQKVLTELYFATFSSQEKFSESLPVQHVFSPKSVEHPLSEIISRNNLKQFHVAETEKYAHVTYFFNGGREELFGQEKRLLVPSPPVATYDLFPEMSAKNITDTVIKAIKERYDFIVLNLANADMLGHTGNFNATVRACQVVDECLGRLGDAVIDAQGLLIITGDHGNADEMVNPSTGRVSTEHSANPVPFICVSEIPEIKAMKTQPGGGLSDIAPTVLDLFGIEKPVEMTGKNLLSKA